MLKKLMICFSYCTITTVFSATHFIYPASTLPHKDNGKKAEQTFDIIIKPVVQTTPPTTCETPASLACIYHLTPTTPGCPIATTTLNASTGAGKTIAIVDAYDYNDQLSDLATYNMQYGLPAATVYVVGGGAGSACTVSDPLPTTQGWQVEHILDLDMAHAMAPYATIYMVEANSDSNNDLMTAEDCASHLLTQAGGGIASNSWGESEYPGEIADDTHFQHPGVIYLVSSGDYAAPPNYPSTSPYVISAGGTTILRNQQGDFIGETGWSTTYDPNVGLDVGSSGGPSLYESRPPSQLLVQKIVGNARGTPDISFDGDPNTGVCVYATYSSGWLTVGGTSVSSPALAGILSSTAYTALSSQALADYIYNNTTKNYHTYWNDEITGNNGYPALAGYDFVTGLGSPRGYNGK